jgi:hypothetical protein
LFSPYKALFEQGEQQRLINQIQENLGTEQNMVAAQGAQQPPVPSGGAMGQSNVMNRASVDMTRANAKLMQ